jgi:hypothetical protein
MQQQLEDYGDEMDDEEEIPEMMDEEMYRQLMEKKL